MDFEKDFETLTEAEKTDYIKHCIFVGGFDKVIEELEQGKHTEAADRIAEYFCIPRKSALYGFASYYAAGVTHGFELACKLYGQEEQQGTEDND